MEYIEDLAALTEAARRLSGADLVAVDTEAAGYHRYRDRICLLQLSTRTDTFLVDTLALDNLAPVSELLAREAPELVFHDADYDLRLLTRDFGLEVTRLFDTKLAAQFLGEQAFGLGALAEKYLAITMEKKHQRADWAQRPLPREMLEYAAEDTRHLPALRDRLRDALREASRLHWAEEEFAIARQTRWTTVPEDGGAFLKVKGARELQPRQLAALRELHAWRELAAEARDAAPFRVLSNEAMLELARAIPATVRELAGTKGLSSALVDRRGTEIVEAIGRAALVPDDQLPKFPRGVRRPPPDPAFDERMDKLRGARDTMADQLGLDRGFLMPRAQLEAVARAQPKNISELEAIPDIRNWQVEALGAEILDSLKQ